MIITTQPPTYIITLSITPNISPQGKQHVANASSYFEKMVQGLNFYGWKYELFPAYDGYLLGNDDWEKIEVFKPKKTKMTEGAFGCFYSHFMLWKKCLEINQPIVVFEHDVIINEVWPEEIEINNEIIKLAMLFPTFRHSKLTGNWISGAYAYLIEPICAKKLIDFSKIHGAIPVDKLIGDKVVDWKFYRNFGQQLCKLNISSLGQSSTRRLR